MASELSIDIGSAFQTAERLRSDAAMVGGSTWSFAKPLAFIASSGSPLYAGIGVPNGDSIAAATRVAGAAQTAIHGCLELLGKAVEFGAVDTLAADTTGITSSYHPSAPARGRSDQPEAV